MFKGVTYLKACLDYSYWHGRSCKNLNCCFPARLLSLKFFAWFCFCSAAWHLRQMGGKIQTFTYFLHGDMNNPDKFLNQRSLFSFIIIYCLLRCVYSQIFFLLFISSNPWLWHLFYKQNLIFRERSEFGISDNMTWKAYWTVHLHCWKNLVLVCLFVKIKNHKILTVPYKFQVRKKGNPSLSEAVRIRDTWVHSILTTFFPSPNEEPSQQDIWSPLPPHMQPRYGF